MKTKAVGRCSHPETPEEFHALGAQLDRERAVLGPKRAHGFVVKARTWEEMERCEHARFLTEAHAHRRE